MSQALTALQARGLDVAAKHDEVNLAQRGRIWTRAETLMGFVGEVGDLAQLAMARDGWCWPSVTRWILRRRTAKRWTNSPSG